ncbi:MAG: alpha-glucosidase/alpha-galactosidase [Verrucomicrobiales bacterium]
MPLKITFIGAGSVVFAKRLIGDILQFPELGHAHICLMDIDSARLKVAEIMTQRIVAKLGVAATVSATTDRREAVRGAKYVICTIQVGGYKPGTVIDFEIPKKYGLRQTIADTLGVGGVFRALRTIPVINGLAQDMAEVGAPGAVLLNYTNPMAMNCWAVDRAVGIPHVGLCHSVQGTANQLCSYAGLSAGDVSYLVAGINHMAFFLRFQYRGQDIYPLLFQLLEQEDFQSDKVRFEMMRRTGYFVTESSEHQSEYVPYFIHHGEELIQKFDIPLDEYIRRCEAIIASWEKSERELLGGKDGIDVEPQSHEYGAYIVHSMETGMPRVIYGNVPNRGLISNLPQGCCVEVPCLIDANGIQPTTIGALPAQLAALCQTNINVQALTVEAALTQRREAIYHAVMLDPHTSATLPLDKIWAMVDDLIEAHQKEGLLSEFTPTLPATGRGFQGVGDRIIARLEPLTSLQRDVHIPQKVQLLITNPLAQTEQLEFTLKVGDVETQRSFQVAANAQESFEWPLDKTEVDPSATEIQVELSCEHPQVLAIGCSLRVRSILDARQGPAPFELDLAGFPAVKGHLQKVSDGLEVTIQVSDSQIQPQETPHEGSCVELFFAQPGGRGIKQLFLVPQPGESEAKLLDTSGKQLLGAAQEISSIDYKLSALLPWEALGLDAEGSSVLFDCIVRLQALGDAHSGGRTSLNGKFQSNRSSKHYSELLLQ